jgi:hypothetical protein
MTKSFVWWKENRGRILRTLSSDRGSIGGGGSTFILLGISFGIILLSFPGRMVLPDSPIALQPVSTIQVDPIGEAVQGAQRACVLSLSNFDNAGIVLDPAAPHLNLKDPRIKILMKGLFKTPQI